MQRVELENGSTMAGGLGDGGEAHMTIPFGFMQQVVQHGNAASFRPAAGSINTPISRAS